MFNEVEFIRRDTFPIEGGELPIDLWRLTDDDGAVYGIDIDGVEWLETEAPHHAVVLFELLREHVTEYMQYATISENRQ